MREPKESKIRLMVVDDQLIVRKGVKALLLDNPEVEVVGEAETAEGALEKVRLLQPNVVLMDIRLRQGDGLEATRAIKKEYPAVGVIMLSNYDDAELVHAAIQAGASGYFLKGIDLEMLLDGIQIAYGGGAAFDIPLLQSMTQALMALAPPQPPGDQEGIEALTKREQEMLRLIGEGKTNPQIARELSYAVGTIKNMVQVLFLKLHVTDRAQAVLKGVRLGIIR